MIYYCCMLLPAIIRNNTKHFVGLDSYLKFRHYGGMGHGTRLESFTVFEVFKPAILVPVLVISNWKYSSSLLAMKAKCLLIQFGRLRK